jgi:hypothetical protein
MNKNLNKIIKMCVHRNEHKAYIYEHYNVLIKWN